MTEKRASFLRIAEKRTNKVLEAIRILGNCSNKTSYDYTEEDVLQMFGAIEEELSAIKAEYLQVPREPKPFVFDCKEELNTEYPEDETDNDELNSDENTEE